MSVVLGSFICTYWCAWDGVGFEGWMQKGDSHKHIHLASRLWRIYQYLLSGTGWKLERCMTVEFSMSM